MGHHRGRDADDFFFSITKRWAALSIEWIYDRERHGKKSFPGSPEIQNQFKISPLYQSARFSIFTELVYSRYRNMDIDPDPLTFNINTGSHRSEVAVGIGIIFR